MKSLSSTSHIPHPTYARLSAILCTVNLMRNSRLSYGSTRPMLCLIADYISHEFRLIDLNDWPLLIEHIHVGFHCAAKRLLRDAIQAIRCNETAIQIERWCMGFWVSELEEIKSDLLEPRRFRFNGQSFITLVIYYYS